MTLPDFLRKTSVEALFKMNSFSNSWELWKSKILSETNGQISSENILHIGDYLADVFQTTGEGGRSQSSLSGGGAAWEALVAWYINLCCIGTRVVAVKKMSLVPKPLQHAITVNYGNHPCNTESDITVIVFPNEPDYLCDIADIGVNDSGGSPVPIMKKELFQYSNVVDNLARRDFRKFGIGIVQCKTNWNDNAQIPMLWDMIYAANGFKDHKITIGKEGYSIKYLDTFSYAFVTVPSNKRAKYKTESVAVKRVTNLSGGNYWGKPTQAGVARSVKEILNNNYQSGFGEGIRESLAKGILQLKGEYSYFNLT